MRVRGWERRIKMTVSEGKTYEAREEASGGKHEKGEVEVTFRQMGQGIRVNLIDNKKDFNDVLRLTSRY